MYELYARLMVERAGNSAEDPWNCGYRWPWATMWVLETKSMSSEPLSYLSIPKGTSFTRTYNITKIRPWAKKERFLPWDFIWLASLMTVNQSCFWDVNRINHRKYDSLLSDFDHSSIVWSFFPSFFFLKKCFRNQLWKKYPRTIKIMKTLQAWLVLSFFLRIQTWDCCFYFL